MVIQHKIWQVDSQELVATVSYFKAKKHQIRFWLGLWLRPAEEAYSSPPTP